MASQSGGSNGQQDGTYPTWPDGSIDQQLGSMLDGAGYMRQLDSSGLTNLSSQTNIQQHLQADGEDDSQLERGSETAQFSFLSGLAIGTYMYNSTSDSMAVPGAMVGPRDTAQLLADTNQLQDGNMGNPYSLMSSFGRLHDNNSASQAPQDNGGSSSHDQLEGSQSGMDGGFGVADVASATTQQFLYVGNGMGGAMGGYNTEEAAEDAGFGDNDTPFRFMSAETIMTGQSGVVQVVTNRENENDAYGTMHRANAPRARAGNWGDASSPVSLLKVVSTLNELREYRRRDQLRACRPPPFPPRAALRAEEEANLNMGGPGLAREYAAAVEAYNEDPFSHEAAAAAAELLEQSFAGSRHMGASADQTYSNQGASEDIQSGDSSYNARASSWNSLLNATHAGHYAGLYNNDSSSFYDVNSGAQGGYSSVPDQLSAFASNAVPATSNALHGYLSHSDTQMQLYLSGYTAGGAYADANGNESVLVAASGGNPDLAQQGQSGAQHTYFNSALTQSAIAPSNAAVQHLSSSLELEGTSHHLGLATNMQAAAQYPYTWRHEGNELAFFPSSNLEAAQESQGLSLYQQSVADQMSQYELFQQQRAAASAASLNQQSGLQNSGGHGLLSSLGAAEGDMGGLGSGQSLSLSLFSQNTALDGAPQLGGVQTDVMSLAAAAEARLAMQDPGSSANALSLGRFRAGTELRHPPAPQGQHLVFRPLDPDPAPTAPLLQGRFSTFRGIYAKSGQDLLLEICSPAGRDPGNFRGDNAAEQEEANPPAGGNDDEAGPSQPGPDLTPDQKAQVEARKTRLISMIGDVDGQYRTYIDHMKVVMVTIDTVMGKSSSLPYTKLALNAMSRHFRALRDAIEGQLRVCNRLLGEPNTPTTAASRGELPRLKYLDAQLRQQKAMQHLGMLQQHAWRPQRGLPEKAVILLRAWLFEHFLHPYPKDSDKITLAKKTGLTRSQVSNWFINARVRLWKPMVEEMYMEESREEEAQSARQRAPPSEAGTAAAGAVTTAAPAGGASSSSAPPPEETGEDEDDNGRGPDEEELARSRKKLRGSTGPILVPPPTPEEAALAAQPEPAPFAGAGYVRYHPGTGATRYGSGTGAGGVSLTLGLRRPDTLAPGQRFQMVLDAARSDSGAGADASLGPFEG